MIENKILFLEALKAALQDKQVQWSEDISAEQWDKLFQYASSHNIASMIYEAVYTCPAAATILPQTIQQITNQVLRNVTKQYIRTSEFLRLYEYLCANGIQPIVVKGIICRNIYPKPEYRISGDEDLWIQEEQFEKCHQLLLDYGMQLSMPNIDIEHSYEVAYGKPKSQIYIEIHKHLFPPESDIYGDYNRFFETEWNQKITVEIDGKTIYTMTHTSHLFYLICHAFKHFLHSGVGIRQVCDIVMFAHTYGKEIDWDDIYEKCKEIRADVFATALFQIGQKYLGVSTEQVGMTEKWFQIEIDETDLLDDLLDAGVYGDSNSNRIHSSNITLNAMLADKRGKKQKGKILKAVFPSRKELWAKYPYLRKYPFLLPIAWIQRIWDYYKKLKTTKGSATKTIQVGNERIALLKKYKIIK